MLQGQMRTVVFDLDGTLADTAGDLIAAANSVLPRPVLGDGDAVTAGHGGRALLTLAYGRLDLPGDLERDYPRFLRAYQDDLAIHTRLYPGAEAALRQIRRLGYATAICTNKPENLARDLVARLGVADLFDALVGAETLPLRKPDPAPYRLAVERAGGGASVLVGDTVTDRDTARNAGVKVALVGFGPVGMAGVAALQPDAVLGHFDELAEVVARLFG